MPMINWCYFSKKEIKRDEAFLRQQNLSNEQLDAIRNYFYKRLSTTATKSAIYGGIAVVVGGLAAMLP